MKYFYSFFIIIVLLISISSSCKKNNSDKSLREVVEYITKGTDCETSADKNETNCLNCDESWTILEKPYKSNGFKFYVCKYSNNSEAEKFKTFWLDMISSYPSYPGVSKDQIAVNGCFVIYGTGKKETISKFISKFEEL